MHFHELLPAEAGTPTLTPATFGIDPTGTLQ
jgi:hypothetical protein